MRRDIRGSRILIADASGGVGRSLAEQAAREGARLALVASSTDELPDLAGSLTQLGAEVLVLPADVTNEHDRQRLISAVVERFDGLDVLINNASVSRFGPFAESSEEIARQIMEVNFFAPAELIRLAVPVLRKGRQPAIVNVGSMCGRRGIPAWSECSASAFALCGLTEALRGEMVRFAIDVLLVLPGLIRGAYRHPLHNTGRYPIDLNKGMTPEKAAAGILRALTSNRIETVLGSEARWALRGNRFVPRLMDRLFARRFRRRHASA
jgi:short-subunit dehydrogenase